MSDDHAAHAIGAYGSCVNQTPNLDRLAREGALLTSVFATNSICTPSRAAIPTGQYSHANGVTTIVVCPARKECRVERRYKRIDDVTAPDQRSNS